MSRPGRKGRYVHQPAAWVPIDGWPVADPAELAVWYATGENDQFPLVSVTVSPAARRDAEADGRPLLVLLGKDRRVVAAGLAEKRKEFEHAYALEVRARDGPVAVRAIGLFHEEVKGTFSYHHVQTQKRWFTLDRSGVVVRVLY